MKTCEQCEHASRATTAGMTSFVWCQENVYGNEDGFVMQSHFINPKAKACSSKFVQRITPLPEEAYIPFTLDGKTEEEASGGDQNDPTTIVSLGASSIDRLKSVVDRFGGIFI